MPSAGLVRPCAVPDDVPGWAVRCARRDPALLLPLLGDRREDARGRDVVSDDKPAPCSLRRAQADALLAELQSLDCRHGRKGSELQTVEMDRYVLPKAPRERPGCFLLIVSHAPYRACSEASRFRDDSLVGSEEDR